MAIRGGGRTPPNFGKKLGQVLDFFVGRFGKSEKLAGFRFFLGFEIWQVFDFLLAGLGNLKSWQVLVAPLMCFPQWFFKKNNLLQKTKLHKVHLTFALLGGNFWLYIYLSIVSTIKTDCLITERENMIKSE